MRDGYRYSTPFPDLAAKLIRTRSARDAELKAQLISIGDDGCDSAFLTECGAKEQCEGYKLFCYTEEGVNPYHARHFYFLARNENSLVEMLDRIEVRDLSDEDDEIY